MVTSQAGEEPTGATLIALKDYLLAVLPAMYLCAIPLQEQHHLHITCLVPMWEPVQPMPT